MEDRINVGLIGLITVEGLGPGTRNEEPFKTLEGFLIAIIHGRNDGSINEKQVGLEGTLHDNNAILFVAAAIVGRII